MENYNSNTPKSWRYYKNLRLLILVNLVIALVITITFNLETVGTLAFFSKWPEFVYAFLISFVLSYGISFITDETDKRISWIHSPLKRLLVEVIAVSIFAFFIGLLFSSITLVAFYDFTFSTLPWDELVIRTKYPIMISLFVTLIFTSRSFLFEWKSAAIATEKMRADKFEGQYQSLKNQLNPHFLFNSFNTLSNLVHEDQDKATEFIQKLSKIYRYVLEVQKEELVSLDQELSFLESYIGLQKLRFGDSLVVNIDVKQKDLLIPPLTLQLLLENAIKHNVVSQDRPLNIKIFDHDDRITISNNLQPKDVEESSTGIGLENIRSQLNYFTNQQLTITKTADEFIVELPLLKDL
ncbi:MAG: histidine kinase [Fulvivirga sp.]|uniref:sensor histidine kinase n=1 Tax=Fulvivirga sp. TaxID=1931237 RepID=UPI0032EAF304